MTQRLRENIVLYTGVFVLVSILFFPPIRLNPKFPALEITDFLIPVFAVFVLARFKSIEQKRILYIITVFGVYILFTILLNGRHNEFRDYFEIVKLIKFGSLIYLFSFIDVNVICKKILKPVFTVLVLINLLHFFNFFNINSFFAEYYLGGFRYSEFGLDSLGMPTNKRMLGLVGNPNINSLVFSFFAIYFLPKSQPLRKTLPWFAVSIFMMFLCQSRTAMIAFVPILITYGLIYRKQLKQPILVASSFVICFISAYFVTKYSVFGIDQANPQFSQCLECLDNDSSTDTSNNVVVQSTKKFASEEDSIAYIDSCLSSYNKQETTYLETMAHGEFLGGSSMKGRYEIWLKLWSMIKKKPLFGYAPNKEYMYANGIYFENEFISMTWKYGFIGLGIYLFLFYTLIKLSLKNLDKSFGVNLLLIIILMLVSSLTNNPFAQKTILVLFAMSIGLLISQSNSNQVNDNIAESPAE